MAGEPPQDEHATVTAAMGSGSRYSTHMFARNQGICEQDS